MSATTQGGPTPGAAVARGTRVENLRGGLVIAKCDAGRGSFRVDDDEATANAHLIAEAFTVHHETGLTPRRLAEQLEQVQAVVTAWQDVFGGIEDHLRDRINCGDPASPQTYLRIIRSDVARVNDDSRSIVNARWADNSRHRAEISRLAEQRAELVAALRQISNGYLDDQTAEDQFIGAQSIARAALSKAESRT